MSEKLKVYSVSAMAFLPKNDALDLSIISENVDYELTVHIEHTAALIPAESAETVAEDVKKFTFEKWDPSLGWYGHQAVVVAVTKQFFQLGFNALNAGAMDEMTEADERFFSF